ncbi:nucleoside deaminase [Aquisalimonas asiatica]|uniref:tRNA(Arg) A34 adenosine deaminase TadA n=1 Tax=Aquisalimonas asiatica TaxID=406100 RepID=A0A1H8RIK3_9GAMM|nr:nucleoside deaminase [Aquisalimonas asiatica]SEO65984.1 tRNA(Arg) A34 adenosine deaminase TadA [Aquisalimonas asiatica]
MQEPAYFMRKAIEHSRKKMKENGAAPFAAVVVKDGKIVGVGVNEVVTKNDVTSHGEVEAIRDAGRNLDTWDLSGCVLYTTCEPCELCVAAMHWARISRMYYANTLDDCAPMGLDLKGLRETVRRDVNDRDLPSEQLLHGEAKAVLDEWLESDEFRPF